MTTPADPLSQAEREELIGLWAAKFFATKKQRTEVLPRQLDDMLRESGKGIAYVRLFLENLRAGVDQPWPKDGERVPRRVEPTVIAAKPEPATPAPANGSAPGGMSMFGKPTGAPWTPQPPPAVAIAPAPADRPTFAECLARIDALSLSDPKTDEALQMLARSDASELQIEDALKRIKSQTRYSIEIIKKTFKALRRNNGSVERGAARPWQPYLMHRDVEGMKPVGNMFNVGLVLKMGEEFKALTQSVFAMNEFSGEIEVQGKLPWNENYPRKLVEGDLLAIMNFCQGVDIPASKSSVFEAVTLLAHDRTFNPVVDFLEECLSEWDRTPRLDGLLSRYCGVEDAPLARAAGARWAISAVARAEHPGCQVDCMLVLEGSQGILKSSFFRELGDPWFVDQISDLQHKDLLIETAGAWIIEFAELDAFRRADVSRIKKYLAFRSDRYRPPFDKLTADVPRRCVFAGTVNPDGDGAAYLRDTTGGRRFWCFYSPGIDLEAVRRDKRQLWGEAVHRYRAKEKWWLHETELQRDAAVEIEKRTEFGINEPWEEKIVPWLRLRENHQRENNLNESHLEPLTIAYVLSHVLGFGDPLLHTKNAQMDVAAILKRHGYTRNTSVRPITWHRRV